MNTRQFLLGAASVLAFLTPAAASACACGCGIFDVGDGNVAPVQSDSGLSVWLRYDYMDQDQNREQSHAAPASDNLDKRIETSFFTLGGEYMINRKWTVMAELPLYDRNFSTTDSGSPSYTGLTTNPIVSERLTDLGDLMVQTTYTGLSPDLSTGLSFGVKLPTGRYTGPVGPGGGTVYDRDSLPGTGSTDLLVGGYHVGHLAGALSWFAQAQYRFAVVIRDDYRPGNEFDGALGVSYDLAAGGAHRLGVTPSLTLLDSLRAHDTGIESNETNSGYERLLIAPGVKLQVSRKLSIYGDVEFPLFQYVNAAPPQSGPITPETIGSGQLTAPALFKLQVNYGF